MKSYTDLEQSKQLAQFLPLESADMFYVYDRHLDKLYGDTPYVIGYKVLNENVDIPCWSLAALLDALPLETELHKQSDGNIIYYYMDYTTKKKYFASKRYTNPIDAAFEIFVWLKDNNKL